MSITLTELIFAGKCLAFSQNIVSAEPRSFTSVLSLAYKIRHAKYISHSIRSVRNTALQKIEKKWEVTSFSFYCKVGTFGLILLVFMSSISYSTSLTLNSNRPISQVFNSTCLTYFAES